MTKVLSIILSFNRNFNFVARDEKFTSICLIFLSVASFITTFKGMLAYTDFIVIALLASAGMQLLMLFATLRFADLAEKSGPKGIFLAVLFFSAMTVSVFFSFASFHAAVEPPQRRVEEADTILRSEWSKLFNLISRQLTGEFSDRLKQPDINGARSYDQWVASVEAMRAAGSQFVAEARAGIGARKAALNVEDRKQLAAANQQQRYGIQDQLAQLKVSIASLELQVQDLDQRARAAEEEADRELKGLRPRLDGKRPKAGDGPDYKRLQSLANTRRAEYLDRQRELDAQRARKALFDQQLNRTRDEESGTADAAQLLQSLSDIKVAEEGVDKFSGEVSHLISVTTYPAGSFDSMGRAAAEIGAATTQCQAIKGAFRPTLAFLKTAGVSGLNGNRDFGIDSNRCSTPPTVDGGATIQEHIDTIRSFIEKCNASKLTASVNAAAAANTTVKPESGMVPDFLKSISSSSDAGYTDRFRALQNSFQICLDQIPAIQNASASQEAMDRFRDLMQTYNPEAHPFTRAIAAFDRRDPAALLAAGIAVVIDALILLTGLAIQKSPVSVTSPDSKIMEETVQQQVKEFVEGNRDFLTHLTRAAIRLPLVRIESEFGVEYGRSIGTDSNFYQVHNEEFTKLCNLNLAKMSGGGAFISDRDLEWIRDAIKHGIDQNDGSV